jgi:chromosome segregation ATPase
MTELIIKMVLCLVAALILGLIIGWLLSRIFQSKKHLLEIDVLSNTLVDRNNHIDMLEKQFSAKETTLLQCSHENRELKEALVEKSKQVNILENQLKNLKSSAINSNELKEENQKIVEELNKYKAQVEATSRELEELETVLVKAEQTIEEKNKLLLESRRKLEICTSSVDDSKLESENETIEALQRKLDELQLINDEKENSIELYKNTISELENELKIYVSNAEDDEFIISKDQFTHIEKKLIEYQKEIKALEEENSRLLQMDSNEKQSSNLKSENMDDISIVKLFRETYKKITKS